MDNAALRDKLLKGSLAGVIRVGLAIPFYLVLTPYALSRLGVVMFGIWSFSTIIISLVNLTDFGFKNSLVRYVAVNINQEEVIAKYFNTAFWMYTLLSIVFVASIVVFSDYIVTELLRVPPTYYYAARFVVIISAISFALRFLATPFQAVIEGFQEHYYSQAVSLSWLIVNSVGSLIALAVKPNIYTLGFVSVAANVLVVALFVLRVRSRFPFARILLGAFDKVSALNLLHFGIGIQIATLVITLREPILKILISRTGGLESLASFEVSYRLCIQLVSLIISPLLGTFAVSALLSNQREGLEKILRPIVGFSCAAFIPAVLFFGSFSPKLVALWLGHEADEIAIEVFLIFTAFAIYYVTEPLYKAIEGSGASAYSASVQLISMAISIAAFFLLTPFDKLAIPFSLLIGFTAFSMINLFIFRRRFKGMVLLSPEKILVILLPAMMYALAGYWLAARWMPILFLIYFILHLIITLKTKIFDYVGFAGKVSRIQRTSMRQKHLEGPVVKI